MRQPEGGLQTATFETGDLTLSDQGLSEAEARSRLAAEGSNELPRRRSEPLWTAIARQLRDPMGLLLVVAAAVTGFVLNEMLEAGAIAAIVVVNGWIAVAQERKAAAAIAGLETFQVPEAKVVRGGTARMIHSADLVRGDLVLVAAGDRIPADCSLIEASDVAVDESMLSGESQPVSKHPGDDCFLGTVLLRGSARAVITATGPRTRVGSIVSLVEADPPKTPLQAEFGRVSAYLGTAAVAVASLAIVLTIPQLGVERALLTGVALAVAAVPEGLTSIVTIALALGARRMADRGSVIRRLSAVETLGCIDVLLTDKTGTLTQNRMTVRHLWAPGLQLEPTLDRGDPPPDAMLRALSLCTEASLDPPIGDPMEVALLEWVGAERVANERSSTRQVEMLPFDATSKRMTTLHARDGVRYISVKGAPEVVLPLCTNLLGADGSVRRLGPVERSEAEEAALRIAREGARVLCVAERVVADPGVVLADLDAELTLVGLVGLADPVRPEAVTAVADVHGAGVEVVMVTGDHPSTAASIGREVGIEDGDVAQPGAIEGIVRRIYARIEPEGKLDLVKALRADDHVVAVTGDGVNDAPALRHADIGVAMGRSGTDAAREAADMVITDDNLATVAIAIREGRGIYDNVRKVVEYLVASNLTEVIVVITALIAFPALGVPLLPLQLLWINLLTDALPAVALGLDPIDESVMSRPPRKKDERLLGARLLRRLLGRAAMMALGSIATLVVAVFVWETSWYRGRALMFLTLAGSQLVYAFVVRAGNRGGAVPNRSLVLAVLLSSSLLVGITLTPGLREVFGTVWMTSRDWLLVFTCSAVPGFLIGMFMRAATRRVERRTAPS